MAKLIPYVLLGVFAAVVVLTILFWGGRYGGRFVGRWSRSWRERSYRHVRWSAYCQPEVATYPTHFVVGAHRVANDGRVLNDVQITKVPLDDDLEREVALQAAWLRAKKYNDDKVGM